MKFAKLFELENEEQVLITLVYEDDEHRIKYETEIEDVGATASFGFKTYEISQEAMAGITMDDAIRFRTDMEKIIK